MTARMRRVEPPDDLATFYASEYARVVGALALYTGDMHSAEEVAQEAFVRVCRDWERVRSMAVPGVWVHRVAINLATSRFRRRAAERRANRRLDSLTSREVDEGDIALRLAVREALARIPQRGRAVLILRFYAGLSVGETSQVLGRSEGTIKTWTHRALAALRSSGIIEREEVTDGT